TLDRYKDAYQKVDFGALQKIFPDVDKDLRTGFRSYTSITTTLDCPPAAVNGDSATLTCHEVLTYKPNHGSVPPPSKRDISFAFERQGAAWIIRSTALK